MVAGLGVGASVPPGLPMQPQSQPSISGASASANLKHDIFVGNLAFNTTEEQLHVAFSEVGRVVNVRMVTDQETGKPRGFAFVEFDEAQAALSAIRNMNDYELNGRRLRVNFSNSSHLEVLAGKLGMDLSQQTGKSGQRGPNTKASGPGAVGPTGSSGTGTTDAASNARGSAGAISGTNAVADSLKGFSKGEMYDVVAKLKEIADRDPDEARRVISGHPQLPEALLFIMSKLEMIKTPLPTAESFSGIGGVLFPGSATSGSAAEAAQPVAAPARAADPRAAAVRVDPRQQQQPTQQPPQPLQQQPTAVAAAPSRIDPRQRADPRAASRAPPPPPTIHAAPPHQQQLPPPPPPPPPPQQLQQQQQIQQQQLQQQQLQQQQVQQQQQQAMAYPSMQHQQSVAHLDPALVQQVLSLTPQQIQQLPLDKQQSILQLRQQITGSM